MKTYRLYFFAFLISLSFFACKNTAEHSDGETSFSVDFEQYTLDNGLQVILHIDRSDPVVAVALTSHVGSAREKEGRTGFAHLFEHLLFLESENLGKGGLDKMSARIGGSGANGSTSRDRTNYYQTVPKDALEKMIWAEADKLGFFINTVTDQVLAKEKQVVKNEKRQGVDNRPYGHTNYVISKNMYPADHPYSWQVIGSLEDLQNATLQDVKDFYKRWYVPNNVTLAIAGDFDMEQAKEWVEKYFGEIKRGEEVAKMEKRAASLTETKKRYHEDNFARLPELTMNWPTVYQYHPDAYPLDVLATYLAEGKKAPFYQVLVEDKQLTDEVTMYQYGSELAGRYSIEVRAYADTDLDQVQEAIEEAFAKFEAEGISEDDLNRIKARQETQFYQSLSSVLGKGFQLAQYQIFAGDPGFINQDVKNILAVTTADVKRVYEQYLKAKPFVATSFVPKGQVDLALEGSAKAEVVEEAIVQGAEESFDLTDTIAYERTASSFDRTKEPPYGDSPNITVPTVWEFKSNNGIRVFGIENDEVPLVQFRMLMKGGQLLDDLDKPGVANMVADMMNKGTANKTPEELEAAIEKLGARVNIYAQSEAIVVVGSCLARNYDATMDLVSEMILQPRWDEEEFKLVKQSTLSQIQQQSANPGSVANQYFQKIMYGEQHILAQDILGTEASVNAITLADLQDYYTNKLSPNLTDIHVVGAMPQNKILASFKQLSDEWKSQEVTFPDYPAPAEPTASQVFFYDVPGAKQSELRFGYPALKATDPDYYPAQVMNYRLGGGGFASQLTQQLREGKGYTYGIRSSFNGGDKDGSFQISSGVRSNVTYESAALVKEILENYGPNYNENDLDVSKSFMIKSNARAFETANAKLNMLENISSYGLPYDYAKQREKIVQDMSVDRIKELANQYLKPGQMYYLVVGDAATQMERLKALDFGDPVLLNEQPLQ